MAPPAAKKGGSALVVDIDLDEPKRPRPKASGLVDDLDAPVDDVAGEMLAKRVLRAFDTGDAAALNKALKAHYEHCKEQDEGDPLGLDEEPASERPGARGMGGRPGEAY